MKKTVFVMMISIWPLLLGIEDECTEITIPSQKVKLYNGSANSDVFDNIFDLSTSINKEVVEHFRNLIRNHFNGAIDLSNDIPAKLYFPSLSQKEVIHLAKFLDILYASNQGLTNKDDTRKQLSVLCKKISHDKFYRKIMNAFKELYFRDEQTIVTKDFMKELILHRPQQLGLPFPCDLILSCPTFGLLLILIREIILYYFRGDRSFDIEKLIVAAAISTCLLFILFYKDKYWTDFEKSLKLKSDTHEA